MAVCRSLRTSVVIILVAVSRPFSVIQYANAFEVPVPPSRTRAYGLGRDHTSKLPSASNEQARQSMSLQASAKGDPSSTLSYYLVWSPRMLSRTLLSFATCSCVYRLVSPSLFAQKVLSWSQQGHSTAIRHFVNVAVLPFLSSACCGIQIFINAIAAGGCAGFNKRLGPIRPLFLGILMSALVISVISSPYGISWTRIGLQLSIAFLPELVHLWNVRGTTTKQLGKPGSSVNAEAGSNLLAQVEFSIPQMGCVACINKINSSVRQVAIVTDSEAWLDDNGGGKARIKYIAESKAIASEIAKTLIDQVRQAGFDTCTMDKLELLKTR